MALTSASIVGITVAVPSNVRTVEEDFPTLSPAELRKLVTSTGIVSRRVTDSLATEDLAVQAVRSLLDGLHWDDDSVDVLIVGTQTSSRHLPGASSLIAAQFNFDTLQVCFDYNLGCSAYPYGVYLTNHFLNDLGLRRAILVTGDTLTTLIPRDDKSLSPLFGDAVAATAIEISGNPQPSEWVFGSDARGHNFISSGPSKKALKDDVLKMQGPQVFGFGLREVPAAVHQLLGKSQLQKSDLHYWAFHQANKLLIDRISLKLDLDPKKVLTSSPSYGNTSGASIPLLLHENSGALEFYADKANLAIVGFGVGLSWAAGIVAISADCIFPRIVEVKPPG